MTQQSLIKVLTQLGVPRNTYDFDVKTPDIELMGQIDGIWSLYFIEKGNLSISKQFSSQEELYDYYLADAYKQQEQRQKTQSMTESNIDEIFAKLRQDQEEQKKSNETQNGQENWRDRLIPWHFTDKRFDEVILWSKRQIDHSVKAVQLDLRREKLAQDTNFLRYLAKDALEAAIVGFLAAIDLENIFDYIGLSARAGTQLCWTYANVKEDQGYEISWLIDGPLAATRTPIDAQALPSYFQAAMYCAFIRRSVQSLDLLAKLPLELLEKPTYTPTPEHMHLSLMAFQKFWKGDIQEAIKLSKKAIQLINDEIDRLRKTNKPLTWREEYHLNVSIHNNKLFYLAITPSTTSAEFNTSLTEAMLAFQKCMRENKHLSDDWNYYLSLGALAWASLATDRGLDVDVISDYIPGFLYKGKLAEEKVKFPISSL
jgi:Immunity protein 49